MRIGSTGHHVAIKNRFSKSGIGLLAGKITDHILGSRALSPMLSPCSNLHRRKSSCGIPPPTHVKIFQNLHRLFQTDSTSSLVGTQSWPQSLPNFKAHTMFTLVFLLDPTLWVLHFLESVFVHIVHVLPVQVGVWA